MNPAEQNYRGKVIVPALLVSGRGYADVILPWEYYWRRGCYLRIPPDLEIQLVVDRTMWTQGVVDRSMEKPCNISSTHTFSMDACGKGP